MAIIAALRMLKEKNLDITIYSDSQYVINSIQKGWLNTWLKTHFKGDKKNPDLWLQYYTVAKEHNINLVWVKGHADNVYNNRCDVLATKAADDTANLITDEGYLHEKETYVNMLAQNRT